MTSFDTNVGFVLGTGRCGSSLVHEILCRHPDVGFLSNLEDRSGALDRLTPYTGRIFDRLPQSATTKGRVRFAPSEGYDALAREVSPLLADPYRDVLASDVTPWLRDRTRRFFAERADRQSESAFLHKFTGWPRTGLLHAAFPTARYVEIVRDGRAVVNSWLQMPWWQGHLGPGRWHWGPLSRRHEEEWKASGESFVVLAAIAWKILIDAADAARSELPSGAWLRIRYEDVLADPALQFGRMLDHFEIDRRDSFDDWLSRYSLDPSRTSAYRNELGEAQVRLVEASIGPQLISCGYEPSPACSPGEPR